MLTEWSVFLIIAALVSFVGVFVGMAWKFGSLISTLESMIKEASQTIKRLADDEKADKAEIMAKFDVQEQKIVLIEKDIIRLQEDVKKNRDTIARNHPEIAKDNNL